MKIISWNINGIRAVTKKGFRDFLNTEKPDILCLQEIKISQKTQQETSFDFIGYNEYWNSAERPGYSGTAILVNNNFKDVIAVDRKLGIKKFDSEGRVQVLEAKQFYLLNVYFPNANPELSRLDYKLAFNDQLLKLVKKLEVQKPVIISGDFNVAHQEIDLAHPQANKGRPGFTQAERDWFSKLLAHNFIDSFRYLNGDKIQYSWWSYRARARAHNIGWRIDYFCVSDKLKKKIKQAYILDKVLGSDHAPVVIKM